MTDAQAWHSDAIPWGETAPDGTRYALLEGRRDAPGTAFTYAFSIPPGFWDAPHWCLTPQQPSRIPPAASCSSQRARATSTARTRTHSLSASPSRRGQPIMLTQPIRPAPGPRKAV
jgi:hypothetical protein